MKPFLPIAAAVLLVLNATGQAEPKFPTHDSVALNRSQRLLPHELRLLQVDLLRSYHELTGKHLVAPAYDAARLAYGAPFVLLSHDGADDPLLTYGNLIGQKLFAMDWRELVGTPSRETAEVPERAEREELLRRVAENGYIDDYSGVRIAADGRRFTIRNATVWNASDVQGRRTGQAASFSEWAPLAD